MGHMRTAWRNDPEAWCCTQTGLHEAELIWTRKKASHKA